MKKFSALLLAAALLAVACKKDDNSVTEPDHDHDHEAELITTVALTFVGPDEAELISNFKFSDLDGAGGNVPVIDTIRLNAGAYYSLDISFLDESKSPAEDITAEVKEEDDEHLICFSSTLSGLSIERMDTDGTYGVGLNSRWTHNGNAENGSLTLTLKHQPGVKDGTCAPGETDVEVTFPVVYQ